jgi:hypothetical protein
MSLSWITPEEAPENQPPFSEPEVIHELRVTRLTIRPFEGGGLQFIGWVTTLPPAASRKSGG